ncbi:MAG: GMC family oxidoreductase N-terminal domain-containing protein, partial [Pseudomonadota bacterium]|nr:GMC family oxidoreductase N-terminal domain-containing protein [Pseudomonadota bacterium]
MVIEYDYVIAGGGSAGCVLASRLAEKSTMSVCLVEAGGKGRNIFIKMPAGNGFVFGNPKLDWGYSSTPQKELNNRRIYFARGKALGGTSIVNGMIYMRGIPSDYDSWRQMGLEGWGYEDLLPYFKISEGSVQRQT